MDVFSLFSFLLLFYHCFSAGKSEFATPITADVLDDEHQLTEDVEKEEDEGILVVNTLEKDVVNGIVLRKLQDNLTLSCAYHKDNGKTLLTDHNMRLTWLLPNEDANRTKMWISNGVLWLTIRQLKNNDAGRYACGNTENRFLVGQAQLMFKSEHPASPYPFCSSSSMFMCWGQGSPPLNIKGPQCILFSFLCDGRSDCPNGRDEHPETCYTKDPCQNKLMCADGRCIPKDWCCGNGTFNKYGRNGDICIPHPCCAQHFKSAEKYGEKVGGGWRKKPGTPPLLQMTLYTASFCVLIFLISITFLISIICRARLKRSAEMGRAATVNVQRQDPQSAAPSPRCNYTLVPATGETPSSTYSAVFRRYFDISNSTPPSYSQATADQTVEDVELPSYFELQQEIENEDLSNAQVRRPTDFGMSTLANTLFNARYRPVPQEVVSFGDVSDSDSSCRSPGSHTFNIYPSTSGARPRVESPLSRFGETPEAYLARRTAEQRRIRRANALDRILDRFGLNAPYAVGRDATQNRSNTANALTDVNDNNEATVNGHGRFLNSILGRLRNSFNRNQPTVDQPTANDVETAIDTMAIATNDNNSNATQTERRRPDTPDVLELSLDEIDLCRSATGDTFTLNGRTIHLLGASFEDRTDMYGLSLHGLYVVDGIAEEFDRFVGRPVSPPPYSEVANVAPPKIMGPPPPYKSRENLNSVMSDAQPLPSCSNRDTSVPSSSENQMPVIVESVPSTSNAGDASLVPNEDVFMDIVNCRDDSMSSLNLESIENREKDLQNGNVHKDESSNSISLLDNGNPSVSSNYSLKCAVNSGDADNNNHGVTSPSSSGNYNATLSRDVRQINDQTAVTHSDAINDISNNNNCHLTTSEGNARQLSLRAPTADQTNGNPSSDSVTLNCASDLIGKSQSMQQSVFPPISLEFIDSDCITE